jgi:hypothetical protein
VNSEDLAAALLAGYEQAFPVLGKMWRRDALTQE